VELPAGVEILGAGGKSVAAHLINISAGGLSVGVANAMLIGSKLTLQLPRIWPGYHAIGEVTWCEESADGYQVGLEFSAQDEEFKARMIAQFCHIENYKQRMKVVEGRELSSEEAAMEWINHFAAEFAEACPQH